MKKLLTVTLALMLIFFLSLQVRADKVKIKTVEGVEVIENPKDPAPLDNTLSQIALTEEFTIGEGGMEDEMFAEITSLDVDSRGNIYILDRMEKKVRIFDSTGKLVKTFGEQGQGPGEMNLPVTIQVISDKELVLSDALNQRLMFFSLEGEFQRELSTAAKALALTLPLFDTQGNIIGQQLVTVEDKLMREVRKYDSELNTLFTIASIDNTNLIQGKINPFQVIVFYQIGKDNTILYSSTEDYEINVMNSEGKLVRKILKDYDPVKVTEEDKEEFLERVPDLAGPIKDRIEFPKVFPPYQNFTVDEEWRLYVRTFEKGKEDGEFFFDVFDGDGRYIAEFPFKGDIRVWKKKRLYAIDEDEDGYQILRIFSVLWK